jgi:hypothetical protein
MVTKSENKHILNSIFIGLIGFLIVYFSQLVPWDYHLFNAYAISIILNLFLLHSFLQQEHIGSKHRVFSILNYDFFKIFSENTSTSILILSSTIFIFYLFLLLEAFFQKKMFRILTVPLLSFFVFLYPISQVYFAYQSAKNLLLSEKPMITFLKNNAYKKPVYFFQSVLNFEYPTVDYANALHCSRFPYLLWMPAYIKSVSENPNSVELDKLKKINVYFTQLMAEDIVEKKPEFIFVDESPIKANPVFFVTHINYLSIFLKVPKFAAAWKSYQHVTTIDLGPYCKVAVYQLIKNEVKST